MMVLFFHAARMAMVVFDPYLSSRPLAEALLKSPDGTLITERHYYPTSSIYFYTNRTGLLLNGRVQNLEYGSNAPGTPDVFITTRNSQISGSLSRDSIWSRPRPASLASSLSSAQQI